MRGRGSPASISTRRNHVSFGDCAPPSISSIAVRDRAQSRAPAGSDRSATRRRQPSRRWRAPVRRGGRPRHRVAGSGRGRGGALRCGHRHVVDVDDLVVVDSFIARHDSRRRPMLGQISSIGALSSTHRAPCSAAAARPAMTPSARTTATRRRCCVERRRAISWRVDVRIDRRVVPSQLAAGKRTARQRFAAHETVPMPVMLGPTDDPTIHDLRQGCR